MKKIILLVAVVFCGAFFYSGVAHAVDSKCNQGKYLCNKDRLDRIEKGCSNVLSRNQKKCLDLQADLVRQLGSMNCGNVVKGSAPGVNKAAADLCRKAINKSKPGESTSSPSSSGSASPSGSGSGGSTPSSTGSSGGSGGGSTTTSSSSTPDPEPAPELKEYKLRDEKGQLGKISAPGNVKKIDDSSIITGILNAVYTIVGMIAVLIIVVCGIMIITADGDSQKVATARRGIIYALIGLLIVVSAFIITGVVLSLGNQ